MKQTMKAARLFLDWHPREGSQLGPREVKGKMTQTGNKFWRNPRVEIVQESLPKVGPTEALIKVKACGICGSDVQSRNSSSCSMRYQLRFL